MDEHELEHLVGRADELVRQAEAAIAMLEPLLETLRNEWPGNDAVNSLEKSLKEWPGTDAVNRLDMATRRYGEQGH